MLLLLFVFFYSFQMFYNEYGILSLHGKQYILYKWITGSISFHDYCRRSPESTQDGSLDSTFSEKLVEKYFLLLQRRTV